MERRGFLRALLGPAVAAVVPTAVIAAPVISASGKVYQNGISGSFQRSFETSSCGYAAKTHGRGMTSCIFMVDESPFFSPTHYAIPSGLIQI